VAAALILIAAATLPRLWQERQLRAAGAGLFRGEPPLPATLAGHSEALPAIATRCSNCHQPGQRSPAVPEPAAAVAPRLTGAGLARRQSRRGGPPSAYDAAALCRLLRTGADPALVVVNPLMPRYAASAAQCDALWAYLLSLAP
jgi:hypothetical protein